MRYCTSTRKPESYTGKNTTQENQIPSTLKVDHSKESCIQRSGCERAQHYSRIYPKGQYFGPITFLKQKFHWQISSMQYGRCTFTEEKFPQNSIPMRVCTEVLMHQILISSRGVVYSGPYGCMIYKILYTCYPEQWCKGSSNQWTNWAAHWR